MEIFKIVGIGVTSAILALIVKQNKPEFSIHISIAAGIIIFLLVIGKLASILEVMKQVTEKMDLDLIYVKSIFKIIGIAYVTEFGAQVCRDSGENSVASKIEFGGKVLIMVLALPILMSIFNLIIKLMS